MTHWLDLSQIYGRSDEQAEIVMNGGQRHQSTSGKIKFVPEYQREGNDVEKKRNYICIEPGCFWLVGKIKVYKVTKLSCNTVKVL